MLAEFRDYLKQFIQADHFSIGKIDNSKDKSIGIYSDGNEYRVEAINKLSDYDISSMRILIHWNKNMKETELVAKDLYQSLRYIRDFYLGETLVYYIDLLLGEPIFVGTDNNGVYEYVITLNLYYKR